MLGDKKRKYSLTLLAAIGFALAAHGAENEGLLDREALFGDDIPKDIQPVVRDEVLFKGFSQFEAAYTYPQPGHWSKLRWRTDASAQGKISSDLKWKIGARVDYDAVYSLSNFYNPEVDQNQRFDAMFRETYLDYSTGNFDLRLGRQNVVWGEMVGIFVADVVSARDMREFILPEFDQLRTPQWAARAEYFAGDTHAELLWIPVATYDNIGKPGAQFFPNQPVPPGFVAQYQQELTPPRDAQNMNYGVRLSTLQNGWDLSLFYYRSTDVNQTFYRVGATAPTATAPGTMTFQARHDRLQQYGGTLSKELGEFVLKAETVYTTGRSFTTLKPTVIDGVVEQNTFDLALGLDYILDLDTRFNVQLFQRNYVNYSEGIIPDKLNNGYTLLATRKFAGNWEGQLLFIAGVNKNDWLFRPRLAWNLERNWQLLMGVDIFHGPQLSLFGQYEDSSRVYSTIRYSF